MTGEWVNDGHVLTKHEDGRFEIECPAPGADWCEACASFMIAAGVTAGALSTPGNAIIQITFDVRALEQSGSSHDVGQ